MISTVEVLGFANLFLAGILAGEEFVIYYGVRTPLAGLEERPQTLIRQALIRRLRVLVPAIFMPTILLGAVVTALDGFGTGFVFRSIGVLALLTWALVTLPGTAPINAAILSWDPSALPQKWRTIVSRWEHFASVRPWAAMSAFAMFLTAMASVLAS
jgi:uncharacterized membrane protein